MLYANYHTHTTLCRHASGTEREFVESAIRSGIKILGFADHSPMIFSGKMYDEFRDGHYYSGHRMFPEDAEGYFRTITDLRDEYKNDIEIHVGVELEYYPAFFEKTVQFLEQFPCEYMLLGQHFIDNEIGHPDLYAQKEDAGTYRVDRYVAEVTEAMSTGKFLYLAHPDVLKFTGDDAVRQKMYDDICRAALKYNMPLEINMLGIRTDRNYPTDSFWATAARFGNRVTIGADAHCPEALEDEKSYQKAMEIVNKYNLKFEKKLTF